VVKVERVEVPEEIRRRLMAKFMARGPMALMRARPCEDLIAPVRVDRIRYHPTILPLASWAAAKPEAVERGVENFGFGQFIVRKITEVFDIRRIPLETSPLFPQFGKVLATEDVEQRIAQEVPVDGTEVVEWMHAATASNVVMSAREVEYNKHSQVETRSGDGYIPGVRLSSIAFSRIRGYDYWRRGYATAVFPGGSRNISRMSVGECISRDFLGWAAAGPQYGIQWTGVTAQVRRLATEITSPVGFPNLWGKVAPFFVLQQPNRETQRAEVVMVVDSDRDQRMRVTFRDPNDFRNVIDEGEIDVPRGRSEIRFVVASYPSVPPVVNQMKPEDGTKSVLTRFEVRSR